MTRWVESDPRNPPPSLARNHSPLSPQYIAKEPLSLSIRGRRPAVSAVGEIEPKVWGVHER